MLFLSVMVVGKILFATFRLYSDNLLSCLKKYNANKILPTTVKSKIYRQHVAKCS